MPNYAQASIIIRQKNEREANRKDEREGRKSHQKNEKIVNQMEQVSNRTLSIRLLLTNYKQLELN